METLSTLTNLEKVNVQPDLIILDRLLGNLDSRDFLGQIQKQFPNSPIIVLSALNSPHEKAALLDLGVDDYMGKPFSLIELSARVRGVLRRGAKKTDYIQIGDLVLSISERTVSHNGKKIALTSKEFQVLRCLCQKAGKVFSKFQLMDIVWEANLELESNVLEVTILNIRKKLEESGSVVKILSKRNIGYWVEV